MTVRYTRIAGRRARRAAVEALEHDGRGRVVSLLLVLFGGIYVAVNLRRPRQAGAAGPRSPTSPQTLDDGE